MRSVGCSNQSIESEDILPRPKYSIFSIGGLGIEVNCCHQALKKISAQKYFDFSIDIESAVTADISVYIQQQKEKDFLHKNEVFSQRRSTLYKTTEGYLEQFYLTDDKKGTSIWRIYIDPEFSRFTFCFGSYINNCLQLIDMNKLVFKIFLLQHSIINHQGLIIHATGGLVQGKGIIFAAPSGTGKSTLCQLLQYSSQNRLFSEDRLIIRFWKDRWYVWGTPWHGEGQIARNEYAPLSALIFLQQAPKTRLTQLSPTKGLRHLLQTVSIPWYNKRLTSKGLALCDFLVQEIPMFELAFRPDQTAVQVVEGFAADL